MASKTRKADRARRMAEETFRKPPKDILNWPVPRDVKERAWSIIRAEDSQQTGKFTGARAFLNDYRLQSLRAGRYLSVEEYDQIVQVKRKLEGKDDPYAKNYRMHTQFARQLPDGSWQTVDPSPAP